MRDFVPQPTGKTKQILSSSLEKFEELRDKEREGRETEREKRPYRPTTVSSHNHTNTADPSLLACHHLNPLPITLQNHRTNHQSTPNDIKTPQSFRSGQLIKDTTQKKKRPFFFYLTLGSNQVP